jgi:hypothetical protein
MRFDVYFRRLIFNRIARIATGFLFIKTGLRVFLSGLFSLLACVSMDASDARIAFAHGCAMDSALSYSHLMKIAFLPPVTRQVLTQIEQQNEVERARRLQIGLKRSLDNPIVVNQAVVHPADWTTLPNGWRILSFQVVSSGARGMRLHFENLSLPAGAQVVIYDVAAPATTTLALDSPAQVKEPDQWSGTIFTDHAAIECQVPPGADLLTVAFTLNEVSHIYRAPAMPNNLKEGSCENDATCYPDYSQAEDSVALYTYVQNGNTFQCTGCLLATAQKSAADYFLTARHCISSQAQASTLEFYWLFQTPTCGGDPPLITAVPKTAGGAQMLAIGVSDFCFLQLRQPAPSGVSHAQWTVTPPNSSEILACIHHPDGKFKRASFGVYLGSNPYFLAIQWASGVTEPGSSGAPLFNGNHQLVGQLTGGFDGPGSSCDNPSALDQFGRFDVTYPYIRKWIDPSGIAGGPPPVNGTYYGLFYAQSTGGTPGSSGSITLTTTAKGKYTGKVQMGARIYSFMGNLNANGVGYAIIKRGKQSQLSIQFQINLGEGADALSGLATDGDWTAVLRGDRAVFTRPSGNTNSSPQMGKYTVLIPSADGAGPGGNSFGTVTVDGTGRLRFVGSLADGTRVMQSTFVSRNGQWPLYIPAYRGQGALFSWVTFVASDTADVSGQLVWVKPNPDGFTIVPTLSGSAYNYSPRTGSVLSFSNALVTAMGGNLAQPLQGQVILQPNGKARGQGNPSIKLSFRPSTGVFNGAMSDSGTKQTVLLYGVALQKQNIASGFFNPGPQSGQVFVQPQPAP